MVPVVLEEVVLVFSVPNMFSCWPMVRGVLELPRPVPVVLLVPVV